MTRDMSKFVNLHLKHGNNRGKGTIGDKNTFLINEVLFVEGLKQNLLSISQLCDKGYQIIFKPNTCEISLPNSQSVLLIGKRINNIYLLEISDFASDINCLLTKYEESWL